MIAISHADAADTTTGVAGSAMASRIVRRQPVILSQPPQQHVGVQQERHGPVSPWKAAIRSSGVSSKSSAIATRPRHAPGVRGWVRAAAGTSRAIGLPTGAIETVGRSPPFHHVTPLRPIRSARRPGRDTPHPDASRSGDR